MSNIRLSPLEGRIINSFNQQPYKWRSIYDLLDEGIYSPHYGIRSLKSKGAVFATRRRSVTDRHGVLHKNAAEYLFKGYYHGE